MDQTFNCPLCDQSLEAPVELLGKIIECPACQRQIRVPKLSQPEPSLVGGSAQSTLPPSKQHNNLPVKRVSRFLILGVAGLLVVGISIAVVLFGRNIHLGSIEKPLEFEERPFLGLTLGMSEEEVLGCFEKSGLFYNIEKDKYKDVNRERANKDGREFDENESDWFVYIKGNSRLKYKGSAYVSSTSGRVKYISVSSYSREGLIPVEGEKERADKTFQTLLAVLTRQYGKPVRSYTARAIWFSNNQTIELSQSFDFQENIFDVNTCLRKMNEDDIMEDKMSRLSEEAKK